VFRLAFIGLLPVTCFGPLESACFIRFWPMSYHRVKHWVLGKFSHTRIVQPTTLPCSGCSIHVEYMISVCVLHT
jgi:hypothetical protein